MKKTISIFAGLLLTLAGFFSAAYASEEKASIGCSAVEKMPISWLACVEEAKTGHPDLISAYEKIKQSKASKEMTRSAYLPNISAGADADASWGGSSVSSGGSAFSGSSATSSRGSTAIKWQESYSYEMQAQQLLFDGFKTSYDLSAAERNVRAARYFYDVTSSNVRLRLRTAYVNLLSAQELLKISEEIEMRRRENLELVKLRYEGGREHKGSLMTSEADLAQAVFDVNQAKRSIELARRQLTKELGRTIFEPMAAEGSLEVKDADPMEPDLEALAKSNPLLEQLVAQKEAAKFGVRSAKAQFFPQVFATGSGGKTDRDFPPENTQWALGLSLTLPVFDGGNMIANVSKSKAALGQARADERSGKDGVIYTMADTWTKLQDAAENVDVQLKVLEATRERARVGEAEYATGILSFDNWIIIENNLVAAKRTYISAQRSALLAEANWIQAKGGTLDYDEGQ
jgi:outer membrane protein TolC